MSETTLDSPLGAEVANIHATAKEEENGKRANNEDKTPNNMYRKRREGEDGGEWKRWVREREERGGRFYTSGLSVQIWKRQPRPANQPQFEPSAGSARVSSSFVQLLGSHASEERKGTNLKKEYPVQMA